MSRSHGEAMMAGLVTTALLVGNLLLGKEPVKPDSANLDDEVAELMAIVAKNYPALPEHFTRDQQVQLLKTLARTFPGVEYLTAAEAAEQVQEVAAPHGGPYPGIIVAAQKVLYLRLDHFAQDAVGKACEDIANAARLVRPPVGVILDLRQAAGYDYAGAARLLRLFRVDAPKLEPNGADPKINPVRLPAMAMVGHETAGAAEVFVTLLERAGNALTLGQPTAGCPFPKQKLPLRNGDFLLVPEVPPPLHSVSAGPVRPAIPAQLGPQVSYQKLAGVVNGGDQDDLCLQRAIDLLLSLHALQLRPAAQP